MVLSSFVKNELLNTYGNFKSDCGNINFQIALLSLNIFNLTGHLKVYKKDYHSMRGLIRMINKRRKLLKYLKKKDESGYKNLIKKLKIRK